MESDTSDPLIIPFGVDQWSHENVAVTRDPAGRLSVSSPFSCAVFEHGKPLRLNNSHYQLAFKPAEEAEPDLVANLRDCIKLECDPWNRKALDFIDGYFSALERLVVADEGAIANVAIGYEKLFDRRDWIFSALRPLPRAHLPVAEKYLPVTFAFWTGARLVAVDLDAGDRMPRAVRESERMFREAGIDLITGMPSGEAGWTQFLEWLDPPGGLWQGEALPLGPFPSTALDALLDP